MISTSEIFQITFISNPIRIAKLRLQTKPNSSDISLLLNTIISSI